jgi:hypothetical protein
MSDIVMRLKEAACLPNTGCMSLRLCVCDVMEDAVEEVERLRELASYLTEERRQLRVEAGYD